MSVFDHDYRPYEGRLTPLGSRPLVLARYAMHEAWSSKITIGLFVLSLLPCLVELVIMYVADNPIARALIHAWRRVSVGHQRALLSECSGDAVLVRAGAGGVDCAATRFV